MTACVSCFIQRQPKHTLRSAAGAAAASGKPERMASSGLHASSRKDVLASRAIFAVVLIRATLRACACAPKINEILLLLSAGNAIFFLSC